MAFAVSNYVIFPQQAILGHDTLPIINYVYPEDSAFIAEVSANTPEMIQLFDTLFAPYPFKMNYMVMRSLVEMVEVWSIRR